MNYLKLLYQKLEIKYLIVIMIILVLGCWWLSWQMIVSTSSHHNQKLHKIMTDKTKLLHQLSAELSPSSSVNQASLEEQFQSLYLIKNFAQEDINILLEKCFSTLNTYHLELIQLKNSNEKLLENGFKEYKVEFSLQGTYQNIGEYLFYFNTLPILYKFEKIALYPQADPGDLLEISFTSYMYVYVEKI